MAGEVRLGGGFVELKADPDALKIALAQAKVATKSAVDKMRMMVRKLNFSSVTKSIGIFTKKLMSMRGAIAAAIGVGGLGMMVSSVASATDTLAKTADRLGLTTEALAGLRHSAELTGAGVRAMEMGLQRMTRRVAEAAKGTGEAKEAIKTLGLDAQALAQMSPDQAFFAIAEAMKRIPNEAERVRLTFKIFDSEGVRLKNTMMAGREELEKYADEAKRLGVAVTREGAAKIEVFNDAVYTAGLSLKGAFTQALVAAAPALTLLAKGFTDIVVSIKDSAMQNLPKWFDSIKDKVGPAVEGIKDFVSEKLANNAEGLAKAFDGLIVSLEALAAMAATGALLKIASALSAISLPVAGFAAGVAALYGTAKFAEQVNKEGGWKEFWSNAFSKENTLIMQAERAKNQAIEDEKLRRVGGIVPKKKPYTHEDRHRLRNIGATAKITPETTTPREYAQWELTEMGKIQDMQILRMEGMKEAAKRAAAFTPADFISPDAYLKPHEMTEAEGMKDLWLARDEGMEEAKERAQEMIAEMQTTMGALDQSAADAARSMAMNFDSSFFNPMSENFLNLRSFGSNVLNQLMNQFAQVASKMAMQGLMGKDFLSGSSNSMGGLFGSIFSKFSSAYGGIVDGPQSGYPITAHGREAIIPLNGSKIPVVVKGGDGGKVVENHYHQSNTFSNYSGSDRDQMQITSKMRYAIESMMESKSNEATANNRMR